MKLSSSPPIAVMNTNPTEIAFVLDRSGSMQTLVEQNITAFSA